jgi:hypothetical protein
MTDSFVLIERYLTHRVKFPRLGFAFFSCRETTKLLILGILPDLIID